MGEFEESTEFTIENESTMASTPHGEVVVKRQKMGADFKTGLAFWGFGFFVYDRDPKKMMRMGEK